MGILKRSKPTWQTLISAILSFYDTAGKTPERVYHTFVLGLLAQLSHRFHIRSNQESGLERYDVMMIPKPGESRGIVIELKAVEDVSDLDKALEDALNQIVQKDFASELEHHNIQSRSELAVAFCGKTVRVRANHYDLT